MLVLVQIDLTLRKCLIDRWVVRELDDVEGDAILFGQVLEYVPGLLVSVRGANAHSGSLTASRAGAVGRCGVSGFLGAGYETKSGDCGRDCCSCKALKVHEFSLKFVLWGSVFPGLS